MPTSLLVPIKFRLSEGRLPARPEGGFPPEARRRAELAAESAERRGETAESVTVADRHAFGSADAPALTRRLAFSAVTGDFQECLWSVCPGTGKAA
ncbi:hypothetical protein [Streptomyces subrutilus]|uniref:Uncharacterized protein n=1 Tax=Streptomyces subrutilus TaxID=36818 RepID=A0A1E5PL02_9ACTN|nr:hypothetical protein [Streptomyces subrutilus]OEJ30246.1 hypothetical protein BGK67_01695 [Streptomyces subrutilus]